MKYNINFINQWFRKLSKIIIKFRWVIIAIFITLNVLAIVGITKVQLETSYDNWFIEGDPILVATDEFREVFGNEDSLGILLEADDVFAPEMLRTIRALSEDIEDNVPFVKDFLSLNNFEFTRGTEEGLEIMDVVPDEIPDDPAAIEDIRELAMSKSFWVNRLYSDDSKEAWIIVRFHPFPDDNTQKEPANETVARLVNEIAAKEKYTRYCRLKTTGTAVHQYEQRVYVSQETVRLIGLAFLIAVVVLGLLLRSFKDTLIPLVTPISTLLWLYGSMGWLGIQIDSIVITLPVYLGLAVSIGYSVHLFGFFHRRFYSTGKRYDSVVHAVEQTGWPMLFTSLTTMGGLMVFYIVPVGLVRWMGLSCALTILIVYLLVMTLTPILLSFGKEGKTHTKLLKQEETRQEYRFRILSDWIMEHGIMLVGGFAVLAGICLIGLTQIEVNLDFNRTFGLHVPFVAKFDYISKTKVGAYRSYNVMLRFQEKNRAKNPNVLKKFETLTLEIENFPLVKRTSSLLDIIKDLNQVMHSDDEAYYRIPDTQDMVSQLLLLYEMSAGSEAENWVDYDYTTLRLYVDVTTYNASEAVREFDTIHARAQQLFPDAEVDIVGTLVKITTASDYIARGEILSFLIALCVIGGLMILVFGSFKTGMIAMIPNIFPVFVVGGLMGYANIPLDMMTMMVVPMILGLAVDDTIHFISHAKLEFQRRRCYVAAVQNTFKTVGRSIFMTSFILMVAFLIYLTSPLNLFFNFGMLIMLGVFSALAADYFVTPVLVIWAKPFGKEHEESVGIKDIEENLILNGE